MSEPPPSEPKPPGTRLRRRLGAVLLAAAAVLVWLVAPSREEWRLSGTWHIATPFETSGTLRLRWWGAASVQFPGEPKIPLRWTAADGELRLGAFSKLDFWPSFWNAVQGGPLYDEPEIHPYRWDGDCVRFVPDDEQVWLYRDAAVARAFAEAAVQAADELERTVVAADAAALFGGPVWQILFDYNAGSARLAVFEAGPEGFRRLLTSGSPSLSDRVYLGCRPGGDGGTQFVVTQTDGDGHDHDTWMAVTEPFHEAEDVLPSGTIVRLRQGKAVTLATDGVRRLLVGWVPESDNGSGDGGGWSESLPHGIGEVDR